MWQIPGSQLSGIMEPIRYGQRGTILGQMGCAEQR